MFYFARSLRPETCHIFETHRWARLIVLCQSGLYHVKLITRDQITGCSTSDEAEARVYEKPVPVFTATRVAKEPNRVCGGLDTSFHQWSEDRAEGMGF